MLNSITENHFTVYKQMGSNNSLKNKFTNNSLTNPIYIYVYIHIYIYIYKTRLGIR